MTETNQHFVYNDPNTLKQNMAVLFNNPQHSDTTFIIGDSKLYAWSGLLSVASPKLGDTINLHFENCHDREMKLYGVKNVESFSLVLKYIYGLDINFSQTSVAVICEVLRLSKNYELTNFSKDLTDYLSKIDCFSLESAVVLLNTANKYNIQELYEKVTIFAYHNADELMKHASFQDLHYDVLVNLLKSDWFCSSEFDILKGVLHWHSDLDKERNKLKKSLDKKNVGEDTEDEDASSVKSDQPDSCEQDVAEEMDVESVESDECLKMEKSNMNENGECSSANDNRDSEDKELAVREKTEKCLKTAKSFSENILKSLLALIRISQISAMDMFNALTTEVLFMNYSHLLGGVKYFSQSCESRKKHLAVTQVSIEGQHGVLQNITQVFIIEEVNYPDTKYDSTESYLFEDLTCKISVQVTPWSTEKNQKHEIRVFTSYLTFCSVEDKDWECTTECQLKLISKQPNLHKDLVLPEDNSYTTLTLSSDNPCVEIGKWDWEGKANEWYTAYRPDETKSYTFTLDFKSAECKFFDKEKERIELGGAS
uniref:BTB/POZ domain-containing protein 9 n=1 Tax=Cacopsylla melanoneura TaxID=428564 RepID=A0A8D8MBA4_9HEMI